MNLGGNCDTHTSSLVKQIHASENEAATRTGVCYRRTATNAMAIRQCLLFAVRNPDVLPLSGVLQEPAAFRLLRVEPVDDAALIRPDLLQVSGGHCLRCR